MIKKIFEISRYTFIENIKSRNFMILFIFIAVVLGSGVLFSVLAPAQVLRVILDIGTSAIEIFTFLSCAFISVRIILQEMEDKTVYLILCRPVTRATYILGRFFGVISVMGTYIIIMTAALSLVLLVRGWNFNIYIIGIAFSIFLKILIVTSFSILISLISTSPASSFVSIFFLWTLGHFSEELKYINYLLEKDGIKITPVMKLFYYIIPNFSKLNYKDVFHIQALNINFTWVTGYAVFYSAVLLTFAILIYNRKEL